MPTRSVYNYGPDYNTLSRYSTRPIRRMTLEREANVDLNVAVKSGLTRVEGDKLVVAAPSLFQKPAKPVAPKMVKEKIEKPAVEHGWDGVPDPKAQADLKQKMKSEDPKNVPPPSLKPRDNAETAQSPASYFPSCSAARHGCESCAFGQAGGHSRSHIRWSGPAAWEDQRQAFGERFTDGPPLRLTLRRVQGRLRLENTR